MRHTHTTFRHPLDLFGVDMDGMRKPDILPGPIQHFNVFQGAMSKLVYTKRFFI
jgi:hypothetical protein